jgi:hypothetical protein
MRKIQMALMGLLLAFGLSAHAEVNHCAQFEKNREVLTALEKLSYKLSYSFEELCAHPRIMDIYAEHRSVYLSEEDRYREHLFITLHYGEYSCQYQYILETGAWGDQYCYSTF